MSLVKKLLVFSLVITTAGMTFGASVSNVKAAGNYGAGSLLALQGVSGAAVYYIGSDGLKYVFPDPKTYATWYDNFDDVVRVNVAELDMYDNGGAVTYRPGTKLITTMDTAKIYAVSTGGVVHWIPDEATAVALYGSTWYTKVQDVIPGYFSSSYTSGTNLSTTLPDGTIVSSGGNRYYIEDGAKRPFASADAFEANNLKEANLLAVADLSGYPDGESITGEETSISGYMPGEGSSVVIGGNLTVTLASTTPASGMVVNNAARYPFTKVALTTGSLGATIDTFVVQRGGLGQDGAFASVDILDADTMIPFDQNSKTFNSNHQATFTKDLEIPANTTKYVYLAGNMGTLTNYAGEAPALGVASITLKGGGVVSGSLPLYGNTQTLNATITIGTATVQRGAYTNATSTTIEVGKEDYTFFSFQIEAGSAEDVTFSQISVYQEGTATLTSDLGDYQLYKDGTKVASGTVNDKYINFSLPATTIPKGETYQYQVKADVLGGSARTVDLGVYRTTDLLVKGNTYGYNITPSYSGTGSSYTSAAVYNKPVLSDNQFTVSNGTLTVERSNTVGAENITPGNGQVLGAFKFTVKGEEIDVTALTLTVASTTANTSADPLTGVKLVNASGATVAGPTDPTSGALTVAFTDTFTLPIGESVYKVVANLNTSAQWATDDTMYVRIATPATKITATGVTTGNSITAGPAANVDTNTQTIKAANLTVTRNTLPANATVIAGAQDVLLGSWNFDATNSGEDIRVTSMVVQASSTNFTNLTIYDGVFGGSGVAMSPINDAPADVDGYGSASSTFAFDTPIIVTKGTSKTIQLIGDVNTGAVADQVARFGLTDNVSTTANASVLAYGNTTSKRAVVNLTADLGAVLTVATGGTLTISTYNNPTAALVRAGATGVTFGYIKLEAANESLDLDMLKVYVDDGGLTGTAAGTYQDVTTVYLYNGTTLLGSAGIPSTGYYTFNFPNNTLVIPEGQSKIITIKADLGTIHLSNDNAPATPAADIKFGIGGAATGGVGGITTTGISSNAAITTETYNGSTTTAMVLHKGLPTVTYSAAGSTLGAATAMINGASDIYAFNVAADSSGNEVLLYRVGFEVATGGDGAIPVTLCYLKDQNGNTIGASATPTEMDASGINFLSYTFNNPDISVSTTKEAISIAPGSNKTFKLNCTVSGAGTGDYISVALIGDVASSTPAASHGTPDATGQNVADAWGALNKGNFVWSDNFKNRGLDTDGANATAYGQWYNGYLVNGLGTVGTTTAYTIGWSS